MVEAACATDPAMFCGTRESCCELCLPMRGDVGAKEPHPWLRSPQDWDPLVQSLSTNPKAFDVSEHWGSNLGLLLHSAMV